MFFQRDHFAPHKSRKFEGYYTRTQLEDGGTLAVIFCWVKHAKERGNYVHASYTPSGTGASPTQYLQRPPTPADTLSSRNHTLKAVPSAESMSPSLSRTSRSSFSPAPLAAFKYDFFPDNIDVVTSKPAQRGGHVPFTITAPGIGHMAATADSIEYSIIVPEKHLRVHLVLDAHTLWSPASPLAGPMGGIMRLSWLLPLNWHVRSTGSRATYAVEHGRALIASKAYGEGRAHVEKNWGGSFPRGWIWAQAFSDSSSSDASGGGGGDPWGLNGEFGKGRSQRRGSQDRDTEGHSERSFCVAGGKAFPGVQAYLVGYRSQECQWDFRPPYAVALGRFSPFLRVRHDSRQGEVELSVSSWRRKLDVVIEAPQDTFMDMAAPLRGGHEPGFAHESFRAKVRVRASRRRWPGEKWTIVEECVLGQVGAVQCGALEFGGSFYHKVDPSE